MKSLLIISCFCLSAVVSGNILTKEAKQDVASPLSKTDQLIPNESSYFVKTVASKNNGQTNENKSETKRNGLKHTKKRKNKKRLEKKKKKMKKGRKGKKKGEKTKKGRKSKKNKMKKKKKGKGKKNLKKGKKKKMNKIRNKKGKNVRKTKKRNKKRTKGVKNKNNKKRRKNKLKSRKSKKGKKVIKSKKQKRRNKKGKNKRKNRKNKKSKKNKKNKLRKKKRKQRKRQRKQKIKMKNKKARKNMKRGRMLRNSTCSGTTLTVSSTCLQNAVDSLKFDKNQITNFFKQKTRMENHKNISSNKLGKKGEFEDAAKHMLAAMGGNASNLTCPGSPPNTNSSSSRSAALSKALYLTLLNCSASIKEACAIPNTTHNATTEASLKACAEIFNKSRTASTDCRTNTAYTSNGTAACECWSKAAIGITLAKANNCNAKETQAGVTSQKNLCKTAFGNCKKAEDKAVELIAICSEGSVASSNSTVLSSNSTTSNSTYRRYGQQRKMFKAHILL